MGLKKWIEQFGNGLFRNIDCGVLGALQLFEFFLDERTYFFDAVFFNHKLETGLVAVALVTVLVEDLNNSFAGLQYFVCGYKFR